MRPLQEVSVGRLVTLGRGTPVAVRKLSRTVIGTPPSFELLVKPLDRPGVDVTKLSGFVDDGETKISWSVCAWRVNSGQSNICKWAPIEWGTPEG